MWRDILVAWRFLAKRPIATAIAAATLGIAIATSTIGIAAMDQALWQPARGERGRELITIYGQRLTPPFYQTLSYPDYVDARDRLAAALDLAALVRIEQTLGGGEWPARIRGELVSGNYFTVLRARPHLGRLLGPEDERAGREPAIVLAFDTWRRTFGADPRIVGTAITLGHSRVTVVGVAAPDFRSPAWPSEYWLPLSLSREVFGRDLLARGDAPIFQTVGRERAAGQRSWMRAGLAAATPHAARDGWRLELFPASYLRFWPAYRATVGRYLAVFAGLALCILAIACANLAGLLLARAPEHQAELTIRQALGATRWQLARRLIAEAVVLTAGGSLVAALLVLILSPLVTGVPLPVPAAVGVVVDARMTVVLVAVSLAALLLVVALSAWRGLRGRTGDLRGGLAASATTRVSRSHAQGALVVAQVAIGCALLTAAGLIGRSAWQLEHLDPGFDVADGVVGRVSLVDQPYDEASGRELYRRLQAAVASLPGVDAAALGTHAPAGTIRSTRRYRVSAADPPQPARYSAVSGGYFRTLGIRLLAGREFGDGDVRESEPVAIVNDRLAAQFRGGAIGETLDVEGEPMPRRIVGVAAAVQYNGIGEPPQPYFYVPLTQASAGDVYVHVRTRQPNPVEALRGALRRIDPRMALSDVRTFAGQLEAALAAPRASAATSASAAAVAVVLALFGLYGVLMAAVEQRQRELAIRAAIGASPAALVAGVVRQGLRLVLAGVGLGAIASLYTGRLIGALLVDVAPRDPLVLTLAPLAVVLVSSVAWWAPARHASRVDPASLLRG